MFTPYLNFQRNKLANMQVSWIWTELHNLLRLKSIYNTTILQERPHQYVQIYDGYLSSYVLHILSTSCHNFFQTGGSGDCDVISVLQPDKTDGSDFTFDSSYNGRTPTIPTPATSAIVDFNACQRYAEDSDTVRGIQFLFQFDRKLSRCSLMFCVTPLPC